MIFNVGKIGLWMGLEENTIHIPLSFALDRGEHFIHLGLLCWYVDVSWDQEEE